MFCWNCGKEQISDALYCHNCGTKLFSDPDAIGPAVTRKYAGFWKRLIAWIIDIILLIVISNIAGLVVGFILGLTIEDLEATTADDIIITIASYSIFTVAGWLYYAIFESSYRQATPGKIALGIIVTDSNSKRISFGRAAGRHFSKILSTLILGIGFIMISFTGKKQGLHDMIAGTLILPK